MRKLKDIFACLRCNLLDVWRYFPSDWLELGLGGLLLIGWGIPFWNPWTNIFASNPKSYSFIAQYVDEFWFGLLMISVALIRLWSVAARSNRWRDATGIVSSFVWMFLAVGFWMANHASSGPWTYGFCFCMEALIVWRAARYG